MYSVGLTSLLFSIHVYFLPLSLPLPSTSLCFSSLPQIPGSADLYSYYVDFDTRRLENWEKIIPPFSYNPEVGSTLYTTAAPAHAVCVVICTYTVLYICSAGLLPPVINISHTCSWYMYIENMTYCTYLFA